MKNSQRKTSRSLFGAQSLDAAGAATGTPGSALAGHSNVKGRSISPEMIHRLIKAGALPEASEAARAYLARHKRDPQGRYLVALVAERMNRFDLAREHITKSLTGKEHVESLFLLSRLERREGATDASLRACDRALAIKPGSAPLLIHRAGLLEEAGRYSEARAVVDPLVLSLETQGKPLPESLRYEIAKLLIQEKQYGAAVELIDEVVGAASTPEQIKRLQYYLKAKANDRAGRYDEAFATATSANEIGRLEFDPALYEQQVTTLIENWTAEKMAAFPLSTCDDETPVFVAGMPRSGTSLIDQIIDAHPLAAGVGELSSIETFAMKLSEVYDPAKVPPDCFGRYNSFQWTSVARRYAAEIRRQSPAGSIRVVNKALGNNKLIGLLARLFPKTRVIHALRDPRDVAISCYMGGFNNRIHAWTSKVEWAASAWEQSHRMMEHWKATLDIPILDVQYERLVSDPDTEFPRLIRFLGLEWDDACSDFHKSKRTVRTLSYDQVNRPLYTTSAGRHANYLRHIEEVGFATYPG